ncbi:hypothetical protein L3Q82_004644 [Scortum barcoo]|uniref:Uncharacterized protein n=1 Tax=Scortum barcoo TaxID=214431 RepID=A0ACB8VGN8_9TELE|nr:hypothetical protein L3Q82_004644 [Scortum barcoo]
MGISLHPQSSRGVHHPDRQPAPAQKGDLWFLAACHALMSPTLESEWSDCCFITAPLQSIPHPNCSVENFKEALL